MLPSAKLRCGEVRRDPGGGGINIARMMVHLGASATAVFPAGGAAGEVLGALLRREDVPAIAVPIRDDTREDFTVKDRQNGTEYRFVFPAAKLVQEEVNALLRAIEQLPRAPQYLVASGSLPQGAPLTFFASLARIAAQHGARVAVDSSGPALAAAVTEKVAVIKPNLREFRDLVRCPVESDEQRISAGRQLLSNRPVEWIALTLGADGALLIGHDYVWRGRAPQIQPVSTVGAGDCFLGGFVWRLMHGSPPEEALRFAIAAGSAALLRPGTQLARLPDIQQLLPYVEITPQ